MARDHLLVVEQEGFNEKYRRFRYDDIQALILCQSDRRFYFGLAFGLLFLLGLIVFAVSSSGFWNAFGIGQMLLFAGLALGNFWKGPGGVCQLKTSVSLVNLRAITRWRQFEQILPELQKRVEERQGVLQVEEIVGRLTSSNQEAAETAEAGPVASSREQQFSSAPLPPTGSMKLFSLLFALLLVDAVFALFGFRVTHPVLTVLRAVIILGAVGAAIAALSLQRKAKIAQSVRVFTIAAFAYLSAVAIGVYLLFMSMSFEDPGTTATNTDLFYRLTEMSPSDGTGSLAIFVINVFFSVILGAGGLLCAMNSRTETPQPAPPPFAS